MTSSKSEPTSKSRAIPSSTRPSAKRWNRRGITVTAKEVTRIPKNTVDLQLDEARKVIKLLEALDDHDDVQNVSANFSVSDEVMAEMEASSS